MPLSNDVTKSSTDALMKMSPTPSPARVIPPIAQLPDHRSGRYRSLKPPPVDDAGYPLSVGRATAMTTFPRACPSFR